MAEEEPGRGPLGPLAALRKILPFEAAASSDRLGWVGLEAARYRRLPASELHPPAITHHRLVLFARPPEELDLRYEGVKRHVPPPAGSISRGAGRQPGPVCAGAGATDWLHIFLEPGLVGRVAAEAFELDPARLTVPPLDALDLPQLRAAMLAVDAELTAGGAGGRLAAESLANVLAVHLIRHVLAPRRAARGRDGSLPRGRLRAVVEYIEDHLDAGPTLEQMAAVARLSPYHFARQFKAATGLPPHQYVIARRVERAQAAPAGGRRPLPGGGRRARRLLGPEPVLPSLQAPRRRHAGTIPYVRKNRIKGRKPLQEPGARALYDSITVEARRVARASPVATTGRTTGSQRRGTASPTAPVRRGRVVLGAGSHRATAPRGSCRWIGATYPVIHLERSRRDGDRRDTVGRLGSAPGLGVRREERRSSTGDDDGGPPRQPRPADDRRPRAHGTARLLRQPLPEPNPAGHGDGPRLADHRPGAGRR